ncbi:hypothetical protein V7075_15045 [Neobacillus drentensis]|uniref:hypothetical protein n=1 Tax=Neobacillus drentensis TaxID=220684 RepID=UPI002FFDBB15
MGKEFANKDSVRMAMIAGAILGIIGIGVITLNVLLGTMVLVLAAITFGLFSLYGTDTTVVCHEKGFDELISIFNQKTSHLPYVWVKPREMSNIFKKQERSFLWRQKGILPVS